MFEFGAVVGYNTYFAFEVLAESHNLLVVVDAESVLVADLHLIVAADVDVAVKIFDVSIRNWFRLDLSSERTTLTKLCG